MEALTGRLVEFMSTRRRRHAYIRISDGSAGHHDGQWGATKLVTFTANYVMGIGYLTVPFAMVRSGIALGIACVLFTMYLSAVSAECVLASLSRVAPTNRVIDALSAPVEHEASEDGGGGKGVVTALKECFREQESDGDPLCIPRDSSVRRAKEQGQEDDAFKPMWRLRHDMSRIELVDLAGCVNNPPPVHLMGVCALMPLTIVYMGMLRYVVVHWWFPTLPGSDSTLVPRGKHCTSHPCASSSTPAFGPTQ